MMEWTDPRTGVTARSNGSAVGDELQRLFVQACVDAAAAERAWIADLRACGIKAAHPDDGWVNRDERSVHFAYPSFNDDAGVGDLIALGDHERHRIVRIVGRASSAFSRRWLFEPADGSVSEIAIR